MNLSKGYAGYTQFEYVTEGLPHLLAASDFAVSRAGSNAIFELLAIRKPMLTNSVICSKKQGRSDIECILISNH